MSISDLIVVMKDGYVQQIGKPQDVYDSPVNLFVAKFLGTPQINVFDSAVRDGKLYIGDSAVLDVPGVPDQPVWAGVRPEGFIPDPQGGLGCRMVRVEIMGRDTSIVSEHPAFTGTVVRSIVPTARNIDRSAAEVRFSLNPEKVHIFSKEDEKRIDFCAGGEK